MSGSWNIFTELLHLFLFLEDEAVKAFPPSVHESDSNDSRIQTQSVVSSLEGISLVTTQFSSVTIPDDGNSLTDEDIKRSVFYCFTLFSIF